MNIQEYENKFRKNLIGRWISASGSFSVMMSDEYIFYDNGVLKIISRSVLSGEYVETLQWRELREFSIEINDLDEDDPNRWIEINYSFTKIETDISGQVVLVQNHDNQCRLSSQHLRG